LEFGMRLFERLLSLLAGSDVHIDADQAYCLTDGIADHLPFGQPPAYAAIRLDETVFDLVAGAFLKDACLRCE
jgi:hypothetical protein